MLPYAAPHTLARSPRYLVLDKAREAVVNQTDTDQIPLPGTGKFDRLDPGFVKLYSHFTPDLAGGDYRITATQKIATAGGKSIKDKISTQDFTVVTPQFQLPPNAVHSVFPAQGQAVPVETLPHMVFVDPHLPWAREGAASKEGSRNKVPWVALLVFTPDELTLTADELNGPSSLFTDCKHLDLGTNDQDKTLRQTTTKTLRLRESDIGRVKNLVSACKRNDDTDVSDPAFDTIYVKPGLFRELVRTYNAGLPVPDNKMDAPDISRYQFLSHVRNTNTQGTAESGGGMGMGVFSVVVSHRTGPVDDPHPAPVVAHLVSLEGVGSMYWPVPDTSFVALPSLYSWNYTSLPSGSFNIADKVRHIGDGVDSLRLPESTLKEGKVKNPSATAQRIYARLADGYTITRHRVQTGEVTTAMLRGPLVPTTSNAWPKNINKLSNSGADLQVLDQTLGLMDITYSTAWQLGKTLAITDPTYCAALNRLRTVVQRLSMNKAKKNLAPTLSLDQTVESVAGAVRKLVAFNSLESENKPRNVLDRWSSNVTDTIDLSLRNSRLAQEFRKETVSAVTKLASSADDGDDDIFNELNKPNSTDWMAVLAWIMDRKFLAGIPAHYLILDPSFLPSESLRFFYIDQSWLDAMVDGALSIGNHLESHDDKIRAAIKQAIHTYCTKKIAKIERPPQIPLFGFLLRSDLVAQFPDLRVEPVFDPPLDSSCAPVLRHENIDSGVMLCLFDRYPGPGLQGGLKELRITQPPHQQSFTIGLKLDANHLEPAYRRIYTAYDGSDQKTPLDDGNKKKYSYKVKPATPAPPAPPPVPPQDPPIYNWGERNDIRTLVLPYYADDLRLKLRNDMPTKTDGISTFTDTEATAAMVGIALNDSCYELVISLDQTNPTPPPPAKLSMMQAWSPLPLESIAQPTLMDLVADSIQPQATLPALEDRPVLDMTDDQLAPNLRSVFKMSEENRKAVASMIQSPQDSLVLNKPDFKYKVYPIAYDPAKLGKGNEIPTNGGKPQDLVFSIVLEPSLLQVELSLTEFQFIVPMGPKTTNNLLSSYHGPAPTMLSNLRFNVLVERMDEALLLRVIPRTTAKEGVEWRKIREASFVLNLVEVNDYTQDKLVFIQCAEKYYGQPEWYRKWMPYKVFPTPQR